jgi:ankyrin repeat protein
VLGLGANPNDRTADAIVDWPPLAHAMARQQLPHAQVLLQYGADPDQRWCAHPRTRRRDAGCVSESGPTPLMWARRLSLDNFAALLLQYGADPTARDADGRTADDYEAEPRPQGLQRD